MQLQQFIDKNGLDAKILEFDIPTLTVEQAIKALKCQPDDIIKSMVIVTGTNDFYLVLLQGNRKLKIKKLKKLLNTKDIKLASLHQVKEVTNYKVGDVPPISIELPVIIDELAVEKGGKVFGGGGEKSKLIQISIQELLDCTHPLIADVSSPL
jgi:prolyl-tRNA editing enzyme YbaK/EbsC (Cys-tRNA(Pro) deacylase)